MFKLGAIPNGAVNDNYQWRNAVVQNLCKILTLIGGYKITKVDNWNANLYDKKHSFVSQFGEDIVQLLAPNEGENILDLGCGTGDLTKKINDFGASVKGIDKSQNMVNQARSKYPDIHFNVEDATKLEYTNEFDAVFLNATLHWVKPPKSALSCIYNSLKSQGRFVAEFGGKGNVQQITDEIRKQFDVLQ